MQSARPEEKLARCEVKCCRPLPWRRSGSLRFPLARRRQLESGGVSLVFIFVFICPPKTWQEDFDFEAAFVESRIQGFQILPARWGPGGGIAVRAVSAGQTGDGKTGREQGTGARAVRVAMQQKDTLSVARSWAHCQCNSSRPGKGMHVAKDSAKDIRDRTGQDRQDIKEGSWLMAHGSYSSSWFKLNR
jgi:hypothetical protein